MSCHSEEEARSAFPLRGRWAIRLKRIGRMRCRVHVMVFISDKAAAKHLIRRLWRHLPLKGKAFTSKRQLYNIADLYLPADRILFFHEYQVLAYSQTNKQTVNVYSLPLLRRCQLPEGQQNGSPAKTISYESHCQHFPMLIILYLFTIFKGGTRLSPPILKKHRIVPCLSFPYQLNL